MISEPMTIHLSDSAWLSTLIDDLVRGGCVPSRVDDETVEVIHPQAANAREARTELVFFLRAWQSRHPDVDLSLA
jgi:hypothetical protein